MVIFDKTLVQELKTIGLPVFYNQILDSSITLPVLTYEPMNNSSYLEGIDNDTNSLMYSRVDYYIRIWGHDKEELIPYAEKVDELMKKLGFSRSSYNELKDGAQLCLVFLFKGIGYEKI